MRVHTWDARQAVGWGGAIGPSDRVHTWDTRQAVDWGGAIGPSDRVHTWDARQAVGWSYRPLRQGEGTHLGHQAGCDERRSVWRA